jgi:hypothetical protein
MTLPIATSALTTAFGWNPPAGRYIDLATGRFIPFGQVRDGLESVMEASAARMNVVTQSLIDGNISLADWQTTMMEQIKLGHTASAASANGGWAQMTQSDWGATGQKIRDQYDYLRNFAGQIADGTQPLDGRCLVRADMYGQAPRGTFEAMRFRDAEESGAEEEIRILGDADHCDGCLEQAALGWQPLGILDDIGDEECLTRCHCSKRYRLQTADGEWEEFE